MADHDKYPMESGRRRFVKGVVGSATLAAVGTGTAASIATSTGSTGAGGGVTSYFGIENTDGPAPRGMPQIPIEIDSEGFIKGVWPDEVQEGIAVTTIGGHTYSSAWFQYCGVQTYAGVQPARDADNYFRSASAPPYEWQQESLSGGEKLNVENFENFREWGNGIGKPGIGKPAMGTWRSQDAPPTETIPIQVLRSEKIIDIVENGESDYADWLRQSTDRGFIAWMDKCTHFCCIPAFKAFKDSVKFGAANEVYCPCHQSVYDPFSVVRKTFVALPRPGSGGGGEGH